MWPKKSSMENFIFCAVWREHWSSMNLPKKAVIPKKKTFNKESYYNF